MFRYNRRNPLLIELRLEGSEAATDTSVMPAVALVIAAWRALPRLQPQAAVSVQNTFSSVLSLLIAAPVPASSSTPETQTCPTAVTALRQAAPLLASTCDTSATPSSTQHPPAHARRQGLVAWASLASAVEQIAAGSCGLLSPGEGAWLASFARWLLLLPVRLLEVPTGDGTTEDNAAQTQLLTTAAWSSLLGGVLT